MKTLYIECNMGAAGDMLMSALYELLEDKQGFLDVMNGLGLPGVKVEAQQGKTCGIAGTHMAVTVNGEEETEPGAGAGEGHLYEHGSEAAHDHDHFHEHGEAEDHHHEHGHFHEHGEAEDHHHEHHHDHHHDHDETHDGHHHTHGEGRGGHHHATPGHIADLIGSMDLPEEVKRHARAVYDEIARAEAKAHGCPVSDVHFHEVGALDAVADVTGVCYAMYLIGAEKILVSPVHVGSGTVRCAHGIMPVPAPATANILEGVPVYGGSVKGELCTPTGAALLKHFADSFGPMPVMVTERTGIGIGTKTFDQANCIRVFLGETGEKGNGEITELVCNIDDMTPEALAYACSRLLEQGALDVYTVAGTMKKGRPGHVLTVLCRPEDEGKIAHRILAETTTNGLRVHRCGKYFLTPGTGNVATHWGEVRVKTAEGFGISHAKPEYEDVARLARENRLPYRTVFEEVLRKRSGKEKGGEE